MSTLQTAEHRLYCNSNTPTTETTQSYTDWLPPKATLFGYIDKAVKYQPPPRTKPVFKFEHSKVAAEYNFKILQQHNFNLQEIIQDDPLSPLKPGSEWRPIPVLEPIFKGHPLWNKMKTQLKDGFEWPVQPISDGDRKEDLCKALLYGNHKSARKEVKRLMKSLKAKVIKAWQLPLPVDKLHLIPGLIVAPLGDVRQFSVNDEGQRYEKHRTTHDQSFCWGMGAQYKRSVNDRVMIAALTPCEYGHTFS